MPRRELADILQDRTADRLGASGRVCEFAKQAALVARFVDFFAEVARVGDPVGEHRHDVAGLERDLGLPVIAFGHDPQGETCDFLADLVDGAVAAADQDAEGAPPT